MVKNIIQTTNKDIITSFVFSWSRQSDMSIHEQRVILRILEFCHDTCDLNGVRIKDNLRQIEYKTPCVKLTMPVSDAFFSEIKSDDVKSTLERLSRRTFQFTFVNAQGHKVWGSSGYILEPRVNFGTGQMSFLIHEDMWAVYLNFTQGFRRFELNKALALSSGYAVRFYILMSENTAPLYMTVEDFKKWLGIADDFYRDSNGKHRIDNLEARVIKPSQKELYETCPYTFTYEKIRLNPRNSKSPVVGFRFYSKYQPKFRDVELEKKSLLAQLNPSTFIGSQAYRYLKDNFDLTPQGLNNGKNKTLLDEWARLESDMLSWLELKKRDLRSGKVKTTPQAYIIGSIKRRVEELKQNQQNHTTDIDDIKARMDGKLNHK